MGMDTRRTLIGFALALTAFFVLPEAIRYFHHGAFAGDDPLPGANTNCQFLGGTNYGTINCPQGANVGQSTTTSIPPTMAKQTELRGINDNNSGCNGISNCSTAIKIINPPPGGTRLQFEDTHFGPIGNNFIEAPSSGNIQLEMKGTTVEKVGKDFYHATEK